MSTEKKLNKIASIVENEIHSEATNKSKYNFTLLVGTDEIAINFYKDFIDNIDIDDIEKTIVELKLIRRIRNADDGKTILVSNNGAHYWSG